MYQNASKLAPLPSGQVSAIRRALHHLSEQTLFLLQQELETMVRGDVGRLLSSIDADIARHHGLSVYAKERYYFCIRGLLTRLPGKLKDGFTFQQAAAPYVRLTGRRNLPVIPQNGLPQEVAQIKHTDLLDLRREAERTLLARKNAIERAAALDLEIYEEAFSFQERLLSEQVETVLASKIDKWVPLNVAAFERSLCAIC